MPVRHAFSFIAPYAHPGSGWVEKDIEKYAVKETASARADLKIIYFNNKSITDALAKAIHFIKSAMPPWGWKGRSQNNLEGGMHGVDFSGMIFNPPGHSVYFG